MGSFVSIVFLFDLYQICLLHYAVTVLSIFPYPPLSVRPSAVCLFALCVADLLMGLGLAVALRRSWSLAWAGRPPMSRY